MRWQFSTYKCDSDPNCSETPAIVGEDGCDSWSRPLDLDDSSGRWDPDWGVSSTHRTCDGAIVDAIVAFHRPTSFTYAFVGDRLHLTAGDDVAVLTFRPIPSWWPSGG